LIASILMSLYGFTEEKQQQVARLLEKRKAIRKNIS
jgi:hypothetical protein